MSISEGLQGWTGRCRGSPHDFGEVMPVIDREMYDVPSLNDSLIQIHFRQVARQTRSGVKRRAKMTTCNDDGHGCD